LLEEKAENTMAQKKVRFGVIGCGLMGREFASAAARWCHLLDLDFKPVIVGACDVSEAARNWFSDNVPEMRLSTADYHQLLEDKEIDAIYCAVPHNQHTQLYVDIINSGKHLLGEKPFGIDLPANAAILSAIQSHPEVLVRCSSEFPFTPGAYRIAQWMRENRFGRIIDMEAGFWHSSDLDPKKPINWKRRIAACGEYGCMGDLGMHVVHLPARAGWLPVNVRALLAKIINERPDGKGGMAPCETWDNATLACEAQGAGQTFPMTLSTKRIAPGHGDTWFVRIWGTDLSVEFSTQNPKQLRSMPYQAGGAQEWRVLDLPYQSAYPSITGHIFEFGFSDAILQMWAAFCDELVHGRDGMKQPFYCATPEETAISHKLFTAALESHRCASTVALN
jgi:predicted dehydrogenase